MRIRIAGIARVHAGSHCGSRRRMVRMRIRIAVPQMVRVDVHSHCGDGSCACALGGGMMMVPLGQPCGAHPRARAHARKVHGSARAHRWSAKCRAAHLTTSTSCSHRWRPRSSPLCFRRRPPLQRTRLQLPNRPPAMQCMQHGANLGAFLECRIRCRRRRRAETDADVSARPS